MKEKIKVIFLIIIFIVFLVVIDKILDIGEENILNSYNNENLIYENSVEFELVNESKSNSVLEINDKSFEEEVLKSEKTVLIDFYADWCNPCKILSPIVEEIATEKKDIKVVKINVDESENIALKYEIMYLPTLVVIKDGEEIDRSTGILPKDTILEMLK